MLVGGIIAAPAGTFADGTIALPSLLGVKDVVRVARLSRPEVVAASARASAAQQRPAIVSALDDPQIFPSIDHAPFMGGGADVSLTIQQSFPLSDVRGHRSDAAEAEARRELAQRDRVALVAVVAFWMVFESRELIKVIEQQHALVTNWWQQP